MKRTASLPSLALIAVLALVLGSLGTAVAGPALTAGKVKKIATKVVKKAAPGLSVAHATSAGNASSLAGLPASSYQNSVYTVTVAPTAAQPSSTRTLPTIPNGTYLATVRFTASFSTSTFLACQLYTTAGPVNLIQANGADYPTPGPQTTTVNASGLVIVTGPMALSCNTNTGTFTSPATGQPADSVTFLRVDTVTNAGTAT